MWKVNLFKNFKNWTRYSPSRVINSPWLKSKKSAQKLSNMCESSKVFIFLTKPISSIFTQSLPIINSTKGFQNFSKLIGQYGPTKTFTSISVGEIQSHRQPLATQQKDRRDSSSSVWRSSHQPPPENSITKRITHTFIN
jgi:hypothetical protein